MRFLSFLIRRQPSRPAGAGLILAILVFSACKKEEPPAPDGRRIEVEVTSDGYKPSYVTAQPGEKIVLVFKAGAGGFMGCCNKIVVPSANAQGTVTKSKPLLVGATVPPSGRLTFACDMDMCKGEVGPAGGQPTATGDAGSVKN